MPIKDFDPTDDKDASSTTNNQVNKIEEYFWLKNTTLITDWLKLIGHNDDQSTATDFWKYIEKNLIFRIDKI